jgi:hypothetical protein
VSVDEKLQKYRGKLTTSQSDTLPNPRIFESTSSVLATHHLEQLLGHDMKGNPTYIGQTLQKIADLLHEHHIEFAVAGALALGIRDQPRYTSDIDVLVHPDEYHTLEKLFRKYDVTILMNDEYMMTVKDSQTGVEIDVLFSPFDPEESARATATTEDMFGVSVPVIQSEYLLWMYLLSDQEKHKVDGINLIQSENVNLEKLSQYLDYDGDEQCLETLSQWVAKAAQEQQTSYSRSVRQRKSLKDGS